MDQQPATCPTLDARGVTSWVFDLDNTLYPAASNLFARVSVRMTRFICSEYGLGKVEARSLQRQLFLAHGTTLRGLMVERDLDPERFLEYVHDIDLSDLEPDPRLAGLIARLPGRKVIFTNGSVPHAERITSRLGLVSLFEGTFDIVASGYIPKPDPRPYDVMIARFGIEPASSVMIEDMAANLRPAAARGMTTVWLRHDAEWARAGADSDHIHHRITDLSAWLEQLLDHA